MSQLLFFTPFFIKNADKSALNTLITFEVISFKEFPNCYLHELSNTIRTIKVMHFVVLKVQGCILTAVIIRCQARMMKIKKTTVLLNYFFECFCYQTSLQSYNLILEDWQFASYMTYVAYYNLLHYNFSV